MCFTEFMVGKMFTVRKEFTVQKKKSEHSFPNVGGGILCDGNPPGGYPILEESHGGSSALENPGGIQGEGEG